MLGHALEFDRAALAGLHEDAARGRALAARGGVPHGRSRDGLLRRPDVREDLLDRLPGAARGHERGAGPDELQELTARRDFGGVLGRREELALAERLHLRRVVVFRQGRPVLSRRLALLRGLGLAHAGRLRHMWHVLQSVGALFCLWQLMQKPILRSLDCWMTFMFCTSPWHFWQGNPRAMCHWWLKYT